MGNEIKNIGNGATKALIVVGMKKGKLSTEVTQVMKNFPVIESISILTNKKRITFLSNVANLYSEI